MELNNDKISLRPLKIKNDELIRLGTYGDGGYIVSKSAIEITDALISIGIKDDWNFESDFLKLNKKSTLIALDLVVDTIFFLKCSIKSFFNLKFNKGFFYFLIIIKFILFFKLKKNIKYIKKGVSGNKLGFQSLSEIIDKLDISKNKIMLKIDIEGDEYSLIDDFVNYQKRIHMICIEFHNVISDNNTFMNFLNKLSQYYSIVHIHMNNNSNFSKSLNVADVIEITFANKLFFELEKSDVPFIGPTNLDYPCNSIVDEISFML